MTHNHSDLAAGEANVLKAVSGAVAVLALFVYSTALFMPDWDARGMSFSIGTLILGVGAGLLSYALRPQWFSGKDRVVGDPWRTHYRTPAEAHALLAPAATVVELENAERPSNAKRFFGVTEHIYAWQNVRRVAPGERIWSRAYARRILGEASALIAAMVLTVVAGVGAAVLLGVGGLDLSFVAAVSVLCLVFGLSIRSVQDSEVHPTVAMEPVFDADWQPTVVRLDAKRVASGPHEVHAA